MALSLGTVDSASGDIYTSVDNGLSITTWLTSSIADGIFSDPICGNGLCEAPQEYKAVNLGPNNTKGCASDCGTHLSDLTPVAISVIGNFRKKTQNTAHTHNFCRKNEDVCWYETYQQFKEETSLTPNITKTINIMDGEWQIEVRDGSGSGLTSGSVSATLKMVNYSSPSNATYTVSLRNNPSF